MKMNKQNKQYDCLVLEAGFAGTALKGLQHFSRASYGQAALRGAGIGASVGGVGNVVNNAMKRDDDPTKRGMGKAFIKGAMAGAGTGATMGAGARFITNRKFAQDAMQNLAQKAHGEYVGNAIHNASNEFRAKNAELLKNNPTKFARDLRAHLAAQNVEANATQDFAREYGYKVMADPAGRGPAQLKITTGYTHPWHRSPTRDARRRYYDVLNATPDLVDGEARNIPEVLTKAADRRY